MFFLIFCATLLSLRIRNGSYHFFIDCTSLSLSTGSVARRQYVLQEFFINKQHFDVVNRLLWEDLIEHSKFHNKTVKCIWSWLIFTLINSLFCVFLSRPLVKLFLENIPKKYCANIYNNYFASCYQQDVNESMLWEEGGRVDVDMQLCWKVCV